MYAVLRNGRIIYSHKSRIRVVRVSKTVQFNGVASVWDHGWKPIRNEQA